MSRKVNREACNRDTCFQASQHWRMDREWRDGGMSDSGPEAVQRIFGKWRHQEEFHRRFLKKS